MELGIVTDEVSDDLEQALKDAAAWGIRTVELRTLWGMNVARLTESQMREVALLVASYNVRVHVLDSPLFKCPLFGRDAGSIEDPFFAPDLTFEEHMALLERLLKFGQSLRAPWLRVFTFWRTESPEEVIRDVLVPRLRMAADTASRYGIGLLVENIPECNVGTSAEAYMLMQALGNENIHLLWDPGNARWSGEDGVLPGGYQRVKSFVRHVHIKDVRYASGEGKAVMLGEGDLDYRLQLKLLRDDGYDGVVSAEPECLQPSQDRRQVAMEFVRRLRGLDAPFHCETGMGC